MNFSFFFLIVLIPYIDRKWKIKHEILERSVNSLPTNTPFLVIYISLASNHAEQLSKGKTADIDDVIITQGDYKMCF